MSHDRLLRGLVLGRGARLLWVEASESAKQIAKGHGLREGAARLAGELVVANLLMSAYIKGDERVSLQLQATRPACSFHGEVDAEGHVRARLTPDRLTGAATLDGMMLVIKHDARQELYRGVTPVEGQSVDAALNEHLRRSDQVAAMVRIDAALREDGSLKHARGILLERLPDAAGHGSVSQARFDEVVGSLRDAPFEEVQLGVAFAKIGGEPLELLELREVVAQCRCSQTKVEATLYGLGVDALGEMLHEDGGAEVTCHFCGTAYQVSAGRLGELIAEHGYQA